MDPNTLIVKRTKLIYPNLSYTISGLLFKVHNNLGRFHKEKTYSDALENLLKESAVVFEREKRLDVNWADLKITKNWADFLVDNKIVLEIKSKRLVTKDDYFQTLRYLELLNLPLGIIVNFRQKLLSPKRILNPKCNLH